jgi:hypothetical protein
MSTVTANAGYWEGSYPAGASPDASGLVRARSSGMPLPDVATAHAIPVPALERAADSLAGTDVLEIGEWK